MLERRLSVLALLSQQFASLRRPIFGCIVNPLTVALTFLVAVLLVSAYWGLRYAIVLALGATATFNFYFLPPIGTLPSRTRGNWVALFAFLITAIVASYLAERARRDAEAAQQRRREVELLYDLARLLCLRK